MEAEVKLAVLPLGVWILYGIFSKKNEGKSWDTYRKFAWLGFFAMEFKTVLKGAPYGFSKLPEEWLIFLASQNEIDSYVNPDSLYSSMYTPPAHFYGWTARSKDGSDEYPRHPLHTNGFGSGEMNIEYLRFLSKEELD